MLRTGIKGRQDDVVTEDKLARNVGSGLVRVYATAMMIALTEKAAVLSVEPFLEEGQGTVGTLVNMSHVSATPLGIYDERGLIGEGTHERFIIDNRRFQEKAESK